MNNKHTSRRLLAALVLLSCFNASAEEIRDYYAEPGVQPFMAQIEDTSVESIGPFGGNLQLQHTDLTVPGNGGLDIVFNRSYVSPQDSNPIGGAKMSAAGIDWTMHFGRIVVPSAHKDKVCTQPNWAVTTADNPSIEYQDGSRELLVLNKNGPGLITKSNLLFTCSGLDKIAKSPSGTTYYFNEMVTIGEEASWLVTRIVDTNGNEINFTYAMGSTARNVSSDYRKLLTTVTASDGRVVNLTYENTATGYYTHIESNNQVWTYLSEQVDGLDNSDIYYLKEVTRPDGLKWQYSYNPPYGDGSPESGSGALNQIIYPQGAVSNFSYTKVQFDDAPGSLLTTVVSSKSVSGPDIQAGSWTYTYLPRSVPTIYPDAFLDETIVTTPVREERFQHYGYAYAKYNLGMMWTVGLLYKHQIFDLAGLKVEESVYGWDYRIISDENFFQGRGLLDEDVRVAQQVDHYIWRDGAGYNTYYSNYDQYGNPGTIVRDSPIAGITDHVTNNIYLNDETLWKLGLLVSSTLDEAGTVSYDYDPLTGNLLSETAYGLTTTYTYDPEGNLASSTNPEGQTVNFSNYFRGIARQEDHPEGLSVSRTVNPTGTVASATDGEGKTKTFTYDALNRIESIAYPLHNPVSFSYGQRAKSFTRGNLAVDRTLDGYGREIEFKTTDTATSQSVVITYRYDVAGNRVFSSLPNSLEGTSYEFDVLGRNIRVVNVDGTSSQTIYEAPVTTKVVDEANNITTYLYNFYGNPDFQKELIEIEKPEGQITSILRNKLGQIASISQGMDNGDGTFSAQQRSYLYDDRYFLVGEIHPEIGRINYTRDDLGNMLTKSYGSTLEASYIYDQLNRLTAIDYDSINTSDVVNTYDRRGLLLTTSNDNSLRVYSYDDNQNLINEKITIQGIDYNIAYELNGNDNLAKITYPSGLMVDYLPDALGRATMAGEFASAVEYFPSGNLKQIVYGNGVVDTYTLNQRLLVNSITSSNSAVDLTYAYNPNLTTSSVVNNLDNAFNVNLTYDRDLRLKTVSGPWGNEVYSYDGQNNVSLKTIDGADAVYSYFSGLAYDIDDSNSGLYISYSFDSKGNVTYTTAIPRSLRGMTPPPTPVWEKSFLYNSINQLKYASKTSNNGGSTSTRSASYKYDASGNMVYRQGNSGVETRIVTNSAGMHLGEYVGTDPYAGKENIYVGTRLIATAKNNHSPIIDTEASRTVIEGQDVTLSASVSDVDGNVVNTTWSQIGGDPISFTTNGTSISFAITANSEGNVYTFQISVTDDLGGVSYQQVTVTVAPNTPPVANAGPDQTVLAGTRVYLDGSGSTDAEGIASYQWTQTAGTPVQIRHDGRGNYEIQTSESLPDDETVTVELTVTDTKGLTSTDTMDLHIISVIKDADADGLPDYWENQYFGSIGATPDGDPDGDGLRNLQEFTEKTNPSEVTQPGTPASTGGRKSLYEGMHGISWTKTAAVNGYNVYWGYSANLNKATANKIVTKSTSATIFGPLNNSTLYFMVEAFNASGPGQLTEIKSVTARSGSSLGWSYVSPFMEVMADPKNKVFSSSDRGGWFVAQVQSSTPTELTIDGFGPLPPAPAADVSGFKVQETQIDIYRNASVLLTNAGGNHAVLAYQQVNNQWSSLMPVGASAGEPVSSVIIEDVYNNAKAIYYWVDALTGKLTYQEYCFSCGEPTLSEPTVLEVIQEDLRDATQVTLMADDYGKGMLAWSTNPGGNASSASLSASYLFMDRVGQLTFSMPRQVSSFSSRRDTAEFSIIGASFYDDKAVLIASEDSSKTGDSSKCFEVVYDVLNDAWSGRSELAVCSKSGIRRYRSNSRGDSVFVYSVNAVDVYASLRNKDGVWFNSYKLGYESGHEAILSGDAAVLEDGTVHVSWLDAHYATSVYFANFRRIEYSPALQGWVNPVAQEFTPGGNLTPSIFVVQDRLGGVVCGVYHGRQYNAPGYWLDIGNLLSGPIPPNSAPTAVLTADNITVQANGVVNMEVTASDPDGTIASYLWDQTEGPAVPLSASTSTSATFTAPDTSVDLVLKFAVTVTDNDGDKAVEEVTVNVIGHGLDADPPTTQITTSRTSVKGKVSFDITLTASEPGTTYFRMTGQGTVVAGGLATADWQEYTGQVTINLDKNGTGSFEYYSVDASNNQEAVKTEVLQ